MDQSLGGSLLLVAAGLGAGTVNGVAGGGTLVSFPALLAVGVPALKANVTSTVGIWPGYLGGAAGFRSEINAQRARLWLLWLSVAGAALGAGLLLTTSASEFREIAPWLVLLACALFAVQPLLAKRLKEHPTGGPADRSVAAGVGVFVASIYSGYFGAGAGVILLAVLGLTLPDDLKRTSGLRSVSALVANSVAAIIFVAAAHVAWSDAGLLAGSSLLGGYAGARLARRWPPVVLRLVVIGLGIATVVKLLV